MTESDRDALGTLLAQAEQAMAGKVPAELVSGRRPVHKATAASTAKTAPNRGIRGRIDMVKSSN